jgi:hypothetical protein
MNSLFFQVHAFCFQGATNNQPEILSQVQFLMFYPIGLDPSPKPVGVQKESSPIKKDQHNPKNTFGDTFGDYFSIISLMCFGS